MPMKRSNKAKRVNDRQTEEVWFKKSKVRQRKRSKTAKMSRRGNR